MPPYSCERGIPYSFTKFLYAIIFLWMGHTWCNYKLSVCHHIPVNGAYLIPLQNICIPSYSCERGIPYSFTKYLYAIIFLWKWHTWCLHKIYVRYHIPVNGTYLNPSKHSCMPSYYCEWGILNAFTKYLYTTIFLWMGIVDAFKG
jgi:hypothetical protein